MNKKVLGISIPYYKNTDQAEVAFKKLMEKLSKQLTDEMYLFVFEDGQYSEWLQEYQKDNLQIGGVRINKGVSYARNVMLDWLQNKVNYILFLDSDDDISDDYLQKIYEYCADNTHEIIESTFLVNGVKAGYDYKKVRSGCAGSAIATRIIGNIRFDESLQIGEDTKFMNEVCDLSKYRKKHCDTIYNYQYGINPESLIQKYNRQEIMKERN